MGIDIAGALKAVVALVVLILGFLGIRGYGKSQKEKGRNDMKAEIEEVIGANYKELADDVLDGGHPYRVSGSSIAEVSGPGVESEKRVAADLQREGGASGSNGSDATTS
jgi:hypothetical protein